MTVCCVFRQARCFTRYFLVKFVFFGVLTSFTITNGKKQRKQKKKEKIRKRQKTRVKVLLIFFLAGIVAGWGDTGSNCSSYGEKKLKYFACGCSYRLVFKVVIGLHFSCGYCKETEPFLHLF